MDPKSKNDLARFTTEMTALAEGMLRRRGDTLTDGMIDVYFDDLVEFEIGEIVEAMRRCRRRLVWFPASVEIADEVRAARRAGHQERRALKPAPPSPEDQLRAAHFLHGLRARMSTLRGVKNMTVRLVTNDGGHVRDAEVPATNPMPETIGWGVRIFVNSGGFHGAIPIYREGSLWMLVD